MSFWWVNQRQTYNAERQGNFLWAPQRNKNGRPLAHWTTMSMVRPGDLILHYARGIRAVSHATSAAVTAPRPDSLPDQLWQRNGWLLQVDMTDLHQPIGLNDIPHHMRSNSAQPVFTSHGTVNQGYLFQLTTDWFSQFSHHFATQLAGTPAAGTDLPPELTAGATALLHSRLGNQLHTITGSPNTITEVQANHATVATDRSPNGTPVPIADVQAALDILIRDGTVTCQPPIVGYRSAFIGALLRTIPGTIVTTAPPTVTLISHATPRTPALQTPQGPLDIQRSVTTRTEQPALRRLLLANRSTAPCDLCGQHLPSDLLIAAHIKKRSLCADNEKRDLTNIGMLACKLGCDDYYELGYITIDTDGTILTITPTTEHGTAVTDQLARLAGQQCQAFTQANAHYFEWHRTNTYRGKSQ